MSQERHGHHGVGDRRSTEDERHDAQKKEVVWIRVPFPKGFLSAHERGGVGRHVDLQFNVGQTRLKVSQAVSAPLETERGCERWRLRSASKRASSASSCARSSSNESMWVEVSLVATTSLTGASSFVRERGPPSSSTALTGLRRDDLHGLRLDEMRLHVVKHGFVHGNARQEWIPLKRKHLSCWNSHIMPRGRPSVRPGCTSCV